MFAFFILPLVNKSLIKVEEITLLLIFNGIAYLGYRPTFEGKKLLLEVNLFGFNGNLYKKTLNIYFFNFIRRDKKFKNKISLITQMKKDLTKAKFDLKKKIIL